MHNASLVQSPELNTPHNTLCLLRQFLSRATSFSPCPREDFLIPLHTLQSGAISCSPQNNTSVYVCLPNVFLKLAGTAHTKTVYICSHTVLATTWLHMCVQCSPQAWQNLIQGMLMDTRIYTQRYSCQSKATWVQVEHYRSTLALVITVR